MSDGRKFVVLGGGTGIFPCLKGLKDAGHDVTAIVTVADDGGSSGRLRKDFYIQPPGDLRNCLVALSNGDPLISDLFSYRFKDSILKGHSLGNLILAVLTRLTGDFGNAVDAAGGMLDIRGRVLPSTSTRVVLVAEHPDGSRSTGEQVISRCGRPIAALRLRPDPAPVSDEIRQRIGEADLIVLGPGSLYTSIIPNLLVPGMVDALESARAPITLIGNLMTQPGETDARELAEHVAAIAEVGGLNRLSHVVHHTAPIANQVLARYSRAGAHPVLASNPLEAVSPQPKIIGGDFARLRPDGRLRHDEESLAKTLIAMSEGAA